MTLKLENFEPLLAWLDAGCPHTGFNMDYAINRPEDLEDDGHLIHSVDNDCGSVCCIAGYVYQQINPKDAFYSTWSEIELVAAEHLGLTPDRPYESFKYTLFDPNAAPEDCTPQEAAEAVRRVMKGEPAWT